MSIAAFQAPRRRVLVPLRLDRSVASAAHRVGDLLDRDTVAAHDRHRGMCA
jgi:hypothetical protein